MISQKRINVFITLIFLFITSKLIATETEYMYLLSFVDLESESKSLAFIERHPSVSYFTQILIKRELEKFSDEISEIGKIAKEQTIEIEQYKYDEYRFFIAKKRSFLIAMVTSPNYPPLKMMEFLTNMGSLQHLNEGNKKILYQDIKRLYSKFQTIAPSKIQELLVQVEQTKGIMQLNITNLLDNGEKIEHIAQKADETQELARIFSKTAKKVRRNKCLSLWCCGCFQRSYQEEGQQAPKNKAPKTIRQDIMNGIYSMRMER